MNSPSVIAHSSFILVSVNCLYRFAPFYVAMQFLSRLQPKDDFPWSSIAIAAAIFTAGFYARGLVRGSGQAHIVKSPRSGLLTRLSKDDLERLPYPLDALPGGRNVQSPYGSLMVFEFGPEDGRKVLLIHGISTPCLTLGGVAHGLADSGCRVMLFDL